MKRKLNAELNSSIAEASITNENTTDQQETCPTDATSTRFGDCEVCAAQAARYSCPKCEVKTCCLRCVQIHKKELDCDGKRDRTKFIPLRNMNKTEFMSDYYFLEECTRFCEDRKYDRLKHFTRYNKVLPTHLFRLRNAAAERNTTLRFLLQNFTRNKENTTYYDWKLRKIFWRIEWIFTNACSLQYTDERCAEDVPLAQLLDKYVNPQNVELVPQKTALEYYQSVGVFGLKILLKAEGIKESRTRVYLLDASKTLKQNFAGKTIVEFPSIYVSYEATPAGVDIIDSDEDVEKETKSYQRALDELQKQQREARFKKESAHNSNDDSEESHPEVELHTKLSKEKRHQSRYDKLEEFEKAPNNYLFADDTLLDMISTSEEDEAKATVED